MISAELGEGVRYELRSAADRFTTRTEWLDSRHSFSFGPHYDPGNVGFGALMVSNEERVHPGQGFDLHPHRNNEIVTWVLSGSLVHQDSAGHHGVVYPGLAQRMSAGRGIDHAERNDAYRSDGEFRIDPDRVVEPVHYVQMWLRPDAPDTVPSYQQRDLDSTDLARDWLPVASGAEPDAAITIGSAGSTLWATRIKAGEQRRLPVGERAHLFMADGIVEAEEIGELVIGDAVRLSGTAALRITARSDAELLVWTFR